MAGPAPQKAPQVFVSSDTGMASVINPETFEPEWVHPSKVGALAADGWVPESPDDYRRRVTKETYDAPGLAGLAGAARGATFGLSDVLLGETGVVDPRDLRLLQDVNPTASAVGDVAGAVGSAALGGPGALVARGAGKVGAKASQVAARALGKHSTNALPRLAGTLTTGAVEGAAYGAGHGISQQVLDPEASLSDFASSVVKGAAAGAAFGALGEGARAAGRRVKASYDIDLAGMRALKREVQRKEARAVSLKASGASEGAVASVQQEAASAAARLAQKRSAAGNLIARRAVAYGIGHALGGGIGPGLLAMVVAPKVVAKLRQAIIPAAERVAGQMGKANKAAERASSAFSEMFPQASQVVGRAAEVGSEVLGSAALHAATTASELGIGGAALKQVAATKIARVVKPLATNARVGVIDAMSDLELSEAAEHIAALGPMEAEMGLRLMAGPATPPEAVDAAIERVSAAAGAVQRRLRENDPRGLRETLAAIEEPSLALERLAADKAGRASVEALRAVYPEMMQQISDQLLAEATLAKLDGHPQTRDELRRLALITGNASIGTPTNAPDIARTIQQALATEAEQTPPRRPRQNSVDLAESRMTRAQRALDGRA